MARRLLVVPQIGEVILTKRRTSKNIRISVNAAGQIRVGTPYWTPYEAGLLFVRRNREWIQKQLLINAAKPIGAGARIGKLHKVNFINKPAKDSVADIRVTATTIDVKTALNPVHPAVQKRVRSSSERALRQQAENLLPRRVKIISRSHKLGYRNLKIRKLTSRWGSCSSKKDISLSFYLIQLPWELVDYVILHELAHTVIPNHSRRFWDFMERKQPNTRVLRRQIKSHKPRIEPY